jgi:hypothetical protein
MEAVALGHLLEAVGFHPMLDLAFHFRFSWFDLHGLL